MKQVVTYGSSTYSFKLEFEPIECPYCHCHHMPHPIHAFMVNENNAIILCQCTAPDCSKFYHFIYYHSDYGSSLELQEMPSATDVQFDKDIIEVSHNFCDIYNQANKAEQCGLKEVAGIGYRKSLEFLIKDYLITIKPGDSDNIKKKALAKCIRDDVENINIKNVAKRATWLGNDETHYVRLWEDKNINDLKKLISLCCHWIIDEIETAKIINEMAEPRK